MKLQNLVHILIWIVCLALLANAEAVNPPPDGGYPGHNTAEGQNALLSLTTGIFNTANGWLSLRAVTTGSFNTGVGAGTLALNTGDENTAIGTAALLLNTASGNTAIGSRALLNNTTGGTLETVAGTFDVGPNVAVGQQALESNTVASANTAVGYEALQSFTSGPMGFEHAGLCTAVGFQALANANGSGFINSAFGYQALVNNTTGNSNTAIGRQALRQNIEGDSNTAVGNGALYLNTTGTGNIAIGEQAGFSLTTGDDNIDIGNDGVAGESGTIRIGDQGTHVATFIGGIYGATASGGAAVYVNSAGQLGTATSSQRYKQDIHPMDKASEAILGLLPVSFRYKGELDPAGIPQFGLVAEQVEKVNPDLVVRDQEGKPYTVRYEAVNAMLLNEFLKEHQKVEEQDRRLHQQGAMIAQQQKQIDALTAGLQKVSAQLEAGKLATGQIRGGGSAPQMVNNP